MTKVKIGKIEDFPEGELKGMEVEGKKLLITKIEGKIYAVNSICTHEHGPLEEGTLEGYNVMCPLHLAVFDVRDGKVVEAPAEESVKSYQVSVEEEEVFVEI